MIKGSTIIMSEAYIEELTRHKENAFNLYEKEDIPNKKEDLKLKYENLCLKLEEALSFQDVIDEVVNLEIPSLAIAKTVSGLAIPLANITVL